MRHITQQGVDLIKGFEGFSEKVYKCPAGYKTIGYGHLLQADERYEAGITKTQAGKLLRQDVANAEFAVVRMIEVPLTNCQFDALVCFAFNVGAGQFQTSTLRKVLNEVVTRLAPCSLR